VRTLSRERNVALALRRRRLTALTMSNRYGRRSGSRRTETADRPDSAQGRGAASGSLRSPSAGSNHLDIPLVDERPPYCDG